MILCSFIFFINKIWTSSLQVCQDESIAALFQHDVHEYKRNCRKNFMTASFEFENTILYNGHLGELLDIIEKLNRTKTKRSVCNYAKIVIKKDFETTPYEENIECLFNKIFCLKENNVEYSNESFHLTIFKKNSKHIKNCITEAMYELKERYSKNSNLKVDESNIFHIFLFEEIYKNNPVKKKIKRDFTDFLTKIFLKVDDIGLNKILLVQCFDKKIIATFKQIKKWIEKQAILNKIITKIDLSVYKNFESSNFFIYQIVGIPIFENGKIKEIYYGYNVLEEIFMNESFGISNTKIYNRIIKNIQYVSNNVVFNLSTAEKAGLTNTKLINYNNKNKNLHFYNLVINIKAKENIILKYVIGVSIEKCKNNYTKKVIVVDQNKDNELFNIEYEIDKSDNIGFPLSKKERKKLYSFFEKNNDPEIKRLIIFVNLIENVILGRDYLYFWKIYKDELNLDDNIFFYKNEIFTTPITKQQIENVIKNSAHFKKEVFKNKKILDILDIKKITIYTFKESIFLEEKTNFSKHLFKGLLNHYFYIQELKFYSDITDITGHVMPKIDKSCNLIIKIKCEDNIEHMIIIKEEKNNNRNFDDNFDLNKYDDLLKSLFDNFFSLTKKYTTKYNHTVAIKNFDNEHFKNIKNLLYDNNSLRKYIESLVIQGMAKINIELCKDDPFVNGYNNDCKKEEENEFLFLFEKSKEEVIKSIMEKYISIFRESIKEKNYYAYVISSLSDLQNNSEEILNLFMNN